MNKIKLISLIAGFVLATAFTLSCFPDGGDDGSGNWNKEPDGNNSNLPCGRELSGFEFCYQNEIYEKCNGNEYNPKSYICCNNNQHAISTHFCIDNKPYQKCSGKEYDTALQGCCNSILFDVADQRCYGNAIQTKCGTGSSYYNPETQFCNGNNIMNKCGGEEYDTAAQGCCNAILFDIADQRCYGNAIQTKCGTGSNYHNPETQFCNGNNVMNKCGGEAYDPATYGCCGNSIYNPETHGCSGGVASPKGYCLYTKNCFEYYESQCNSLSGSFYTSLSACYSNIPAVPIIGACYVVGVVSSACMGYKNDMGMGISFWQNTCSSYSSIDGISSSYWLSSCPSGYTFREEDENGIVYQYER